MRFIPNIGTGVGQLKGPWYSFLDTTSYRESLMLYIFAVIFPPLGLLLAGRVGAAVLNFIIVCISIPLLFVFGLGLLTYIGAIVHACVVIAGKSADRRTERIVAAVQQGQPHRR